MIYPNTWYQGVNRWFRGENRTKNKKVFDKWEKEFILFETELEMLKNEVPVNSAIADMVFATYFEEKGLYLQAIPYYQRAIEKEPNIVEYQNAYNVFLYKIGLDSFLGNN
mgnify:CR=1 FL=1